MFNRKLNMTINHILENRQGTEKSYMSINIFLVNHQGSFATPCFVLPPPSEGRGGCRHPGHPLAGVPEYGPFSHYQNKIMCCIFIQYDLHVFSHMITISVLLSEHKFASPISYKIYHMFRISKLLSCLFIINIY